MTYERFSQLWDEHFIQPLIRQGVDVTKLRMDASPRLLAALHAAAEGDFSHFDAAKAAIRASKGLPPLPCVGGAPEVA